MHRSASWSRVSSDEYVTGALPLRSSPSFDSSELPLYDPIAEMAKKEKARVKFAENAVHVIPLVLILCATVLWLFSNPEIEMGIKGGAFAGKEVALNIDGEIENVGDGTQNGVLPILEARSSKKLDFGIGHVKSS